MQAFYENNKDDIEILAVNLTNVDKGQDAINAFVLEYGLTFPIPLDEDGMIGMQYQAFSIPTSFVIDSEGII
ncbi:TlpA disulfide reductase family protein [Sutcliffiella deserti]|uniref:TlpA disulfide reductase family protein n=1 Tax=Sutcliffiella deserti TaxID=2875501 RepID=UPI001CBD2C63|nr:TlpA disulfide reductase family protein [Sutcliffiella deserti]